MATTVFTDGVTLSAAAWANDVDTTAYAALTSVGGTANAITATGPANYTHAVGRFVRFVPGTTNTGTTAIVITPSGGSAAASRNIFNHGVACGGGELIAGVPVGMIDDGTQFNIIGEGTRNTFTATGTGFDGTDPTVTAAYSRVNNIVTLHIPSLSGTSDATTFTITGLPVVIRPTTQHLQFRIVFVDNGGAASGAGRADIETDGSITLFTTVAGGAWTASGTKTFNNSTFTYNLN